jgi:hypothetical protein
MSDLYADYTVADGSGAELSIVWVKGGARIYAGGILRSREEIAALRDYLNAQLVMAAVLVAEEGKP